MTRRNHWTLFAVLIVFVATTPLDAQENAGDSEFEIPASDEGLPGAGPIRRYDWFRNLWRAKRSGWAKQVQNDQNAVVFLGDSITQGWGDNLQGSFGAMKVANRGISGDTTRGMLVRLKADVIDLNPIDERSDHDLDLAQLQCIHFLPHRQ